MQDLARYLRILWRADKIIADIHLRRLLTRTGLVSFAGLIAAFGLLMLNVAGYLALGQIWGQPWAAAAMGLFDFGVSLGLVLLATRSKPSHELELALEVRSMAVQGLEAEVAALHAELAAVRTELTTLVRHPLDSALPALIGPLTGIILKSLKSSRERT